MGDRGAAVEDIQRRLLALGYDLGPTVVDGVFLESTAQAVRRFQERFGLYADGVVGPRTWSALVDSTFAFGDRMLYLRTPYFHGNDVLTLQRALNSLGFVCGDDDGIFGTFTERAVVEFQQNAGLGADGIVGPGTLTALSSLRHIWGPRSSGPHSQAHGAPIDRSEVLARVEIFITASPGVSADIARRIANVAEASSCDAVVHVQLRHSSIAADGDGEGVAGDASAPGSAAVVGRRSISVTLVVPTATPLDPESNPAVVAGGGPAPIPFLPDKLVLAQTIGTALIGAKNHSRDLVISIGNESFSRGSKQGIQRVATTVLDALCLALR